MKKWFLIIVGTIIWSLTMVRSGLVSSSGMGFWGANGHDGIWHIALIAQLTKLPFMMPVFAGFSLQNYHIGFDLLTAFLHLETGLSVSNLYFQILPPVFALFVGLLTYWFVNLLTGSAKSAFWSTFFVYFGGGLGWLVTSFRNSIFDGESMFWSQQAISTLINPSFALSLIFVLLGLIFLLKYLKNNKFHFLIFSSVFFGLLIEIKVYAGLLILGGLLVASFWRIIKEKKKDFLLVFLFSLAISVFLFCRFSGKDPQNLIIFQPFWFLETMMGLSDRLGWMKFHSAMTTYRMGGIWIKAIMAYGVAFLVFLIGNMGTRIIFIKDVFKKPDSIKILVLSVITAGIAIPTFFLQKGTPWNTIQFFYYSLFFSAILAGIAVSHLSKYLLAVIVLLTLPTTIGAMKHYLPKNPPAFLSSAELEALSFLKNQPDGVVLTYPFDAVKAKEAEKNPPRPLYLYDSTAYVSAFSNKITFLEDQVNLDITGYDWKNRLDEVKLWYKEPSQIKSREFLKENNIKYIYWLKGDKRYLYATEQRAFLGETELGIEKIFDNKEVGVYVVKSEI